MNIRRDLVYNVSYEDDGTATRSSEHILPFKINKKGEGIYWVFFNTNNFRMTVIRKIYVGSDGIYRDDYGEYSNFNTDINFETQRKLILQTFEIDFEYDIRE